MAQEGVRGYRVTARAVDDVALDPPEVGHRTRGLPGAGRDGSRGLEERGDAVAFVPAARRRDGTAGGVAPDAADCEPLKREGLTTKLTIRGAGEEKAPQPKWLQGLIFTQSGRRDLNPRPPEPHSGALPDCATSRKTRRQGAEMPRRPGKASPPDPAPSPRDVSGQDLTPRFSQPLGVSAPRPLSV